MQTLLLKKEEKLTRPEAFNMNYKETTCLAAVSDGVVLSDQSGQSLITLRLCYKGVDYSDSMTTNCEETYMTTDESAQSVGGVLALGVDTSGRVNISNVDLQT